MGTGDFLKDLVSGTSLGYSMQDEEDLYSSKFLTYVWSGGYDFLEKDDDFFLVVHNFTLGATTTRVVYPLSERGTNGEFLFDAFANINPENRREILDFCNKFGLLQDERLKSEIKPPNLFSWIGIKREVYFIKALLDLWEMSDNPKPGGLENLRSMLEVQYQDPQKKRPLLAYRLEWYQGKYENFLHLGTVYSEDGMPLTDSDIAIKADDLPFIGKIIVAKEINRRLREYSPYIQTFLDSKHNLTPHIMPPNLISAIWLQFQQYITGSCDDGGSRIVRCMFCGKRGRLSEEGWIIGHREGYEGKFYHQKCAAAARQRISRDRRKSAK